jgi:MYXO-CTERM domain-containing protein
VECQPPEGASSSRGCGCSTAGPADAALLLALAALLRRRRRVS